MARSYGRFTTSIWLDPDFTCLTLEQQGAYFTLGLQPDVTAAGVLPYTSRRWSKLSAGMSRDRFEELVQLLSKSDGEHLVIDEDTEEVLIRKFMKWDMGWANTHKRLKVVLDAVDAVASPRIREAAIRELRKIPISDLATESARDALSAELRIRYPRNADTVSVCFSGAERTAENPHNNTGDSLSAEPQQIRTEDTQNTVPDTVSRSDRVVVTSRTRTTATLKPETATLKPQPATREPVALTPTTTPTSKGTRIPTGWRPTPEDVEWAREKNLTREFASTQTERFKLWAESVSGAVGVKRNWSSAWRNWMLRELGSTTGSRPPTTPASDKARGWLDIEIHDEEDPPLAIGGTP